MSSAISRRRFLGGAGAVAAAASLARPAAASVEVDWNPRPGGLFGAADRKYKVLEIFLYGGLSPWESFYIRSNGATAGPWANWRDKKAIFIGQTGSCVSSTVQFLAADSAGRDVFLGPATSPIWPYRSRMRVLSMRHNLLPHEGAIPLALSGVRLGNPRMAGIGAPIARRALSLAGAGTIPPSYILIPPSGVITPGDNLVAATSIGTHPGHCRPLALTIGGSAGLLTQLARSNVSGFPQRDALLTAYRDQYTRELRWQGLSAPLRSKQFGVYSSSLDRVKDAASLSAVLSGGTLTASSRAICVNPVGSNPNTTGAALNLAAYLFNQPAPNGAKYVCVIDGGLLQTSGAGYDTHFNHARVITTNLRTMLSDLAGLIAGGQINLDDTLVVLNTEFGRTPDEPATRDGRDHWPEGYTTVLLGGPVTAAGAAGSIDDDGRGGDSGVATAFTPTDLQGAVLLAAGVRPIHSDVYTVGDFGPAVRDGTATEGQLIDNLAHKVLGI